MDTTQKPPGAGRMENAESGKQRYIEQELDERFVKWLTRSAAWGAFLFLAASALDAVASPENFYPFLRLRLAISLILIVIAGKTGAAAAIAEDGGRGAACRRHRP